MINKIIKFINPKKKNLIKIKKVFFRKKQEDITLVDEFLEAYNLEIKNRVEYKQEIINKKIIDEFFTNSFSEIKRKNNLHTIPIIHNHINLITENLKIINKKNYENPIFLKNMNLLPNYYLTKNFKLRKIFLKKIILNLLKISDDLLFEFIKRILRGIDPKDFYYKLESLKFICLIFLEKIKIMRKNKKSLFFIVDEFKELYAILIKFDAVDKNIIDCFTNLMFFNYVFTKSEFVYEILGFLFLQNFFHFEKKNLYTILYLVNKLDENHVVEIGKKNQIFFLTLKNDNLQIKNIEEKTKLKNLIEYINIFIINEMQIKLTDSLIHLFYSIIPKNTNLNKINLKKYPNFENLSFSSYIIILYCLYKIPNLDKSDQIRISIYKIFIGKKEFIQNLNFNDLYMIFLSFRKYDFSLRKKEFDFENDFYVIFRFYFILEKKFFEEFEKNEFIVNLKIVYEMSYNLKTLEFKNYYQSKLEKYFWKTFLENLENLSTFDIITFCFIKKKYFILNFSTMKNWKKIFQCLEKRKLFKIIEKNRLNMLVDNLRKFTLNGKKINLTTKKEFLKLLDNQTF